MSDKTRYVQRRPEDGKWEDKREGAARAASIHDTQAQAEAASKDIARREGGEVRIRGRDGKFRDSDSYGNDPCPSRDRKH